MDLKIGDRKTLNRPTFLHEGIFVVKGTSVKIVSIEGETISVEFMDREGFPHTLENINPDELS
ncbi:MAG: hypothetical protein OEZ34_15070 [Spirochaetia bacterium]|nr:hypothetical protein [Spirochaetia bacterium]